MNESDLLADTAGTIVADASGTMGRVGPPTRDAERHHQESLKETIESIIVALILAFVFRAFIVEAFVIPTGSMAPTLYGAHGTIVCEDCGTEFAYGLRDLDDRRRAKMVLEDASAVCPNCNHRNTKLAISDEKRNAEKGDRILVLKWPSDFGASWLAPARWDVTVFKDPADGKTNFIKRMAGLPNEVLMILDGDVYSVPTSELSEEVLAELDALRHEKYEYRTGARKGRLLLASPSVLTELDEKLRVARKTPQAQKVLWFPVYNHDHPPRNPSLRQPRWVALRGAKSGWNTRDRRIRFKDMGTEEDFIELANVQIRATCAYNIHARTAAHVSDQRVSFVLTPEQGEGRVQIRLAKHGRTFVANVGMDGSITIEELSTKTDPPVRGLWASGQVTPFVTGEAVEISFENVDYRLSLRIRGEEALASTSTPGTRDHYAPDLAALRSERIRRGSTPPGIGAQGGNFEVAHVRVERDVHYYNDARVNSLAQAQWGPRKGWAGPFSPILLREGEYFMLGDNTAASKDSRLWDVVGPHLKARGEAFQLGTVPADQLIGKAFFVYWPAGHRIDWLPRIRDWLWAIVPDVGRMRWIR
ncbi:MAG: hypothetical protein IIB59_06425 [Planctomycetes bacterium]|nr:hypothetical protein [Planctomycetota bacterium]